MPKYDATILLPVGEVPDQTPVGIGTALYNTDLPTDTKVELFISWLEANALPINGPARKIISVLSGRISLERALGIDGEVPT